MNVKIKLQNYAILRQRGIEFWVWRDWGDSEFWGMEFAVMKLQNLMQFTPKCVHEVYVPNCEYVNLCSLKL